MFRPSVSVRVGVGVGRGARGAQAAPQIRRFCDLEGGGERQ